jgi:hypothetical protein
MALRDMTVHFGEHPPDPALVDVMHDREMRRVLAYSVLEAIYTKMRGRTVKEGTMTFYLFGYVQQNGDELPLLDTVAVSHDIRLRRRNLDVSGGGRVIQAAANATLKPRRERRTR